MEQNYRQRFYDTYVKEIFPKMFEMENERKRLLFQFFVLIGVSVLLLILELLLIIKLVIAAKSYEEYSALIFFLVFTISFILPAVVFFAEKIVSEFKQSIKTKFIEQFLSCFEHMYWNSAPASITLLQSSNLFARFNTIDTKDTFLGFYNNVRFTVQEILLNFVYQTSDGTKSEKIYKGLVICIDSNKKINSKVLIYPKYHHFNVNNESSNKKSIFNLIVYVLVGSVLSFLFPGVIRIFFVFTFIFIIPTLLLMVPITLFSDYFNRKKCGKSEIVKLEDNEFNRKYTVQSQDQIEARYLVTPAFMERLKNVQTTFGSKNIRCAFFEDKIMFAIPTEKDLFEIGNLFVPFSDSRQVNRFFEEITSIYEMIDYFKLDEKTGL